MASEIGKINEDLEPIIRLTLATGAGIDCIVDTGFNGAVMLPADFVAANNLPVIGSEEFRSVGGTGQHQSSVALAGVRWLADEFEVRVFISESDFALIGAEMMIDCSLIVDYVNSSVVIEKTL